MRKNVHLWRSLLAVLVLIILTAACQNNSDNVKKSTNSKPKKDKQAGRAETGQDDKTAAKPAAAENKPAKLAVIETDRGKIVFKFFPKEAPNTVANFIKLADKGFYNGTKFHRVVPGFVIQGGDPLSKDNNPNNDGTGGPGYTIDAEFNSHKHLTGTVAMARSQDINSAGSQFYICLAPQPSLDGQYTVFGQLTKGLDVIQKIQKGDVMRKVYIVNQ